MKFKTRLYVTFTTIVMLPLALTALAFCAIGLYLMNVQKGLPVAGIDYTDAAQNMREVINTTEGILRLTGSGGKGSFHAGEFGIFDKC